MSVESTNAKGGASSSHHGADGVDDLRDPSRSRRAVLSELSESFGLGGVARYRREVEGRKRRAAQGERADRVLVISSKTNERSERKQQAASKKKRAPTGDWAPKVLDMVRSSLTGMASRTSSEWQRLTSTNPLLRATYRASNMSFKRSTEDSLPAFSMPSPASTTTDSKVLSKAAELGPVQV